MCFVIPAEDATVRGPMHISDKGLALIREFEDLRLTVYKDSSGLPTIGIGHKLTVGESYPHGIT